MAPNLSIMFQWVVRLGSLKACWRQAILTAIPKGSSSSSVANYWPISITSVLSKVFECLVSVHLGQFMECISVLPTNQFAYQRGLGTCDTLLCVSHTLQSALESGQDSRIVQIDFSAAFDRINHWGILYGCCSVGIGGSVLSVLTVFCQTDHSTLWWMVFGVNWLMLCQKCRRAVFWSCYCSICTLRSFFTFWKISWLVMLMFYFDGCCAIHMH